MLNLNESCGNLQLHNPFLDCVKRNSPENSPKTAFQNHLKSNLSHGKTSTGLGVDFLVSGPWSSAASLAVDLALWAEDQDFETLVRFVVEGGTV